MNLATAAHYARMADARERDPHITPTGTRADVASGKHGRWGRYNDPSTLVWVSTLDGRMVALTRNQANVYGEAKRLAKTGIRVTMRELATLLKVAPSTVYRACVRLAALGLIAYQSNRGRLGGSVFLLREAKDGLGWCQDAAKVTLRRWYRAAEARISRLRGNVASLHPGREKELYQYRYVQERNKYPAWTPADFREAGLM